jgi:hypothetical protein
MWIAGAEICDYTRLCLWQSAGVGPVSLEELGNSQHEAPAVGRYLRQYLAGGSSQLISRFLDLVERLITAQPGLQQARALLHFVGVAPQQLAPRYTSWAWHLNNCHSGTVMRYCVPVIGGRGTSTAGTQVPVHFVGVEPQQLAPRYRYGLWAWHLNNWHPGTVCGHGTSTISNQVQFVGVAPQQLAPRYTLWAWHLNN